MSTTVTISPNCPCCQRSGSGGSGSGSHGTIEVPCCPGVLLPAKLYATFGGALAPLGTVELTNPPPGSILGVGLAWISDVFNAPAFACASRLSWTVTLTCSVDVAGNPVGWVIRAVGTRYSGWPDNTGSVESTFSSGPVGSVEANGTDAPLTNLSCSPVFFYADLQTFPLTGTNACAGGGAATVAVTDTPP